MDWIAGLPETRRIVKRLALKMKGAIDMEELRNEQMTRSILVRTESMLTL